MSSNGPPTEVIQSVLEVGERAGLGSSSDLEVLETTKLSGGASRLTWMMSVGDPAGGTSIEVVVQQERPGSAGANLSMRQQAELLTAAGDADVPVPEVLSFGESSEGAGYAVLARLAGESLPARILNDAVFDEERTRLAHEVGAACARIHTIDTAVLEEVPTADPLGSMRKLMDALGEPHPAFELGLLWLDANRPLERPLAVLHGDLRMGNLLVDPIGLQGVLDWELAHLGSPAEDLGWFCARAWRFGSPKRAGGVGTVDQLLDGYRSAGGDAPSLEELDWWEAYACLRWGLICVLQASVHLSGAHRSVELAAIGRRADECEEDLLEIIFGPSSIEPPSADLAALEATGPHGRPTSAELLEAVGEHLEAHRGQLSGSDSFHMRVARNVVEMVRREVQLDEVLSLRHRDRLTRLGVSDDVALAAAIRDGSLSFDDPSVVAEVRGSVRDKLSVSHPGYWAGDGADPKS